MNMYACRKIASVLYFPLILALSMSVVEGKNPSGDNTSETDKSKKSVVCWGLRTAGVACRAHLRNGDVHLAATHSIMLLCDTKNVAISPGKLLLSNPYRVYTLTVMGPDGKHCPQTRFGKRAMSRIDSYGSVIERLDASEIDRYAFHLNYLYDMTLPGTYRVSFSRHVWLDGERHTVTSNEIDIEITDAEPPAARPIKVKKKDE